MKYLLIICVLFSSCSIFRKSVNTVREESSKSSLTVKDSVGHSSIDSVRLKFSSSTTFATIDSGYDKVIEEVVKEVIDSGGVRRETTRTIKEKGQKRTEQSSQVIKYDSGAAMINEHTQLQEVHQEDSAAVVVTTQKDVVRSSSWWIWLLAAIPVAICVFLWKRNSIVKLFT